MLLPYHQSLDIRAGEKEKMYKNENLKQKKKQPRLWLCSRSGLAQRKLRATTHMRLKREKKE